MDIGKKKKKTGLKIEVGLDLVSNKSIIQVIFIPSLLYFDFDRRERRQQNNGEWVMKRWEIQKKKSAEKYKK